MFPYMLLWLCFFWGYFPLVNLFHVGEIPSEMPNLKEKGFTFFSHFFLNYWLICFISISSCGWNWSRFFFASLVCNLFIDHKQRALKFKFIFSSKPLKKQEPGLYFFVRLCVCVFYLAFKNCGQLSSF